MSLDSSYLEFPILDTSLVRYVGLNTFSTTPLPTDILFGLKLVSGTAEVKEAGQYRADVAVAIGDVMRVSVQAGVVSYAKNGTVFYTSTQTITDPSLQVDSAFINMGATIANARVSGVISGGSAGAGSGSSSGSGPVLQAPALTLTPTQTKIFRFDWTDISGETEYRLLEDADGSSGYTRIATLPANTARHDLEVFLPGRINARYILQACNGAGCADSAPVLVNGAIAAAAGYIKASNTGAGDSFGGTVALSGDGGTLAVGAWFEDSAAPGVNGDQNDNSAQNIGAVYVFSRNTAGGWIQQAYLKAADTTRWNRPNSLGMQSLALSHDGNTLAVGEPREPSSVIPSASNNFTYNDTGAVYVFTRSAGNWSQQAYLKNPTVVREDSEAADAFGAAVALSADGNTLAIGTPGLGFRDTGGLYIYIRSGGSWAQQALLHGWSGTADDNFGVSAALSADGNILAVGAPGQKGTSTGVSDGENFNNVWFGWSGAVYIFAHSGGDWTPRAYVKASNTASYDEFGTSLALSGDGNTLAVGAPGEDSAATGINGDQSDNSAQDSGAIYVFSQSGGNWMQQAYLKAPAAEALGRFGRTLGLSNNGDTLAAGTYQSSNDTSAEFYVFRRNTGSWAQQAFIEFPDMPSSSNYFGDPVALAADGNLLAVGTPRDGSAATGVNGNQNDNSAPGSGAVYLY